LREELGIEMTAGRPYMRLIHAYDDREVELSLWVIERFTGTPRPLDRQQLKWSPQGASRRRTCSKRTSHSSSAAGPAGPGYNGIHAAQTIFLKFSSISSAVS